MCGIFGVAGECREDVGAALGKLRHRGPDGSGIRRAGDATHGHVRLALLDLSAASSQPFEASGGGVLSFVGEIWNHADLRARLGAAGVRLRTAGDTEVLAETLGAWGVEATLPQLDGMFAFAWTDSSGGTTLARCRWGKVPLLVCRRGGGWSWSSERKAMARPHLARALPPGCLLRLATGRVVSWGGPPARVEPACPEAVADGIRAGVRRRLAADAPVCCLVSGGLDSACVLAAAVGERGSSVAAFVARVGGVASADHDAAVRLCREMGVRLTTVRVDPPGAEQLSAAVGVVEIASKVQVEIATLCVPLAREISRQGFKACLSGEAADELFGGYGNSCIRAVRLCDAGWRAHRVGLLARMARGNFVRCNRAFMAGGVECRLPFMERSLVEGVLSAGKRACPPGKGLLKEAAGLLGVPRWVIARQKETFQGSAGASAAAASRVANVKRFVNQECRRLYGAVLTE